jgi:sulfide:quinone oxidoreductase
VFEAGDALRALAGERVDLTLVAPEEHFTLRALTVFEPFGGGDPRRHALAEVTEDLGAALHRDAVILVDRARRTVRLASGAALPYDVLVLAVGALPYPAYEHGVSYDRACDREPFDELLADARAGLAGHVAVIAPPGTSWALPAYELALLIAGWGRTARPNGVRVTIATAEDEPLHAFGPPASALVRDAMADAGVELITGVHPEVPTDTIVALAPGRLLHADRIVHLPLLRGPRLPGVPADAAGFVLADPGDFRVAGDPAVFAVGDGTAGQFKHGGLAAQQAAAVAERVARRAGVALAPRRYAPVLRGLLRTADAPRYLRAEPPGGHGDCAVAEEPLWWPPSEVAVRWLTPWLATRDLAGRPAPPPRVPPSGGIARSSLSLSTPMTT